MKNKIRFSLFIVISIFLISCSSSVRYSTGSSSDSGYGSSTEINEDIPYGEEYTGVASYYHDKFNGRKTSNGEIFDNDKFTAAHKTLPFGARVKVTNLKNGRTVVVRINDRGPFVEGRIIDLSRAAAEELDMIRSGIAEVKILVLEN